MGLMDVINGMQNGPRGARNPAAASGRGMSPITMAVLGLLAYKALKHFTSQPAAPPRSPGAAPPVGSEAGGLGGLLTGGLGGLLGGGAAGTVLSGGLNDLFKQLQGGGLGNAVNSWVGHGPNQSVSPADLERVLDSEQIKTLMTQTGMSRDDVLGALSEHLPGLVDALTPDGRLPNEQEVARQVQ